MEKAELVSEVAKNTGISQDETAKIIEAFIATVKEGLGRGEKVAIAGFGTFSLSKRKERDFLNPRTKQVHKIPEKFLPNFRPGRNFKIT